MSLGEFAVDACSLCDLARMKRAAVWSKDLIELEVLAALEDEIDPAE